MKTFRAQIFTELRGFVFIRDNPRLSALDFPIRGSWSAVQAAIGDKGVIKAQVTSIEKRWQKIVSSLMQDCSIDCCQSNNWD